MFLLLGPPSEFTIHVVKILENYIFYIFLGLNLQKAFEPNECLL